MITEILLTLLNLFFAYIMYKNDKYLIAMYNCFAAGVCFGSLLYSVISLLI